MRLDGDKVKCSGITDKIPPFGSDLVQKNKKLLFRDSMMIRWGRFLAGAKNERARLLHWLVVCPQQD
jgi:hypothetical protein